MTSGYTYYNQPGTDAKRHDSDVDDCAAEAARTVSVDEQLHNGANQGLVGMMVGGAFQHAYHRGAAAAALENCMVVRGWRVVRLDDSQGAELVKMSGPALAQRLAPWVASATPPGQVVRTFQNDAANGAIVRFATRPGHDNTQLSLKAATGTDLTQFTAGIAPADSTRDVVDSKWPKKPLTAQAISSIPAGGSMLLIQLRGLSFGGAFGIKLTRMGASSDFAPSRLDHAPDTLVVTKALLFAHREGDTMAYAIPAGRWRIAGLVDGLRQLNFCLGAPAFDVAAGEAVYAGSFDLSGPDLGPDLDLGPARRWLAATAHGSDVRAARYINGTRGICGDNAIYALEVRGAPYEPGYAWGGAASAQPALASVRR